MPDSRRVKALYNSSQIKLCFASNSPSLHTRLYQCGNRTGECADTGTTTIIVTRNHRRKPRASRRKTLIFTLEQCFLFFRAPRPSWQQRYHHHGAESGQYRLPLRNQWRPTTAQQSLELHRYPFSVRNHRGAKCPRSLSECRTAYRGR
jgi:hypothetical protein